MPSSEESSEHHFDWSYRLREPCFITHVEFSAGAQFESLHHLLGEFAAYTARTPYLALRPRCRPRSPEHARNWWRYAGGVVRQQLEPRFSWDTIAQVCPELRTVDILLMASVMAVLVEDATDLVEIVLLLGVDCRLMINRSHAELMP